MSTSKLYARGRRGSWFAEVECLSLPCVHEHLAKQWPEYLDPTQKPGDPRSEEYVAALRAWKLAILTKDKVSDDEKHFYRQDYIAIYRVTDIEFGQAGLRLRLADNLADVSRASQRPT